MSAVKANAGLEFFHAKAQKRKGLFNLCAFAPLREIFPNAHGSRLMASSRLQNQLAGRATPVEGAMGGRGIGQGKRAADIDLELPTGDPA